MRRIAILLAVAASAVAALSPAVSSVSSSVAHSSESSYQLLQMNLCLSGQAGCYSSATYASILDEATEQIADREPEAVTLNEVCSADVAELARRTGYELRFAGVDYGGTPLPCIDPRGRGLFGIAVLTKDDIRTSQDRAFAAQADPEERQWLCATTDGAITVCTAHLSTRYSSVSASPTTPSAVSSAACWPASGGGHHLLRRGREPSDLLRPPHDVGNAGRWATQSPGVQHIYGTRRRRALHVG